MANIQFMRAELEKKYNKAFASKMSDAQVVAVYRQLQANNKL